MLSFTVFQPEFEFETVAILDDSVSLVPDDVDGTTHHIITTHTPEIINTQDYDQTHIYTTSSTDKLRAAIPSGIVDTNEVTIETTSYESGTNMCKLQINISNEFIAVSYPIRKNIFR